MLLTVFLFIILSLVIAWFITGLLKKDTLWLKKRIKIQELNIFLNLLTQANVGAVLSLRKTNKPDKVFLKKIQNKEEWWIEVYVEERNRPKFQSIISNLNIHSQTQISDTRSRPNAFMLGTVNADIYDKVTVMLNEFFNLDVGSLIYVQSINLKVLPDFNIYE